MSTKPAHCLSWVQAPTPWLATKGEAPANAVAAWRVGPMPESGGLRLSGRRLLADLDWAAWREGSGVALQYVLNPQLRSIEGIRKDQQG
ncbi:hypothetical protein GCM10011579_076560 [Streptomyces albiflavescens]|uniref:Uncharacterized protein n=1 Tax=Streptomyces albiflavescens TaxID=1623582 RepID=A0A917YBL7_9ACTN|nr:hypothetical protein GCM10011579_076560 [Streptomyces albiflavescens]